MTLLLAFFIILQALAPEQSEGLFHKGKGSFVRALNTFGLGGIWDGRGGLVHGEVGVRYKSAEGQDLPPRTRRIDPGTEDAQQAVRDLDDQFGVDKLKGATGYRIALPSPLSYDRDGSPIGPEEERFLKKLALRLARVVVARGAVVRVSVDLPAGDAVDTGAVSAALSAAQEVRDALIQGMRPSARAVAERKLYSFVHYVAAASPPADGALGRLRIDILLTRPDLREPIQARDSAQ